MTKSGKIKMERIVDRLLDFRKRDFKYSDPYDRNYAKYDIDHHNLISGYEYPNIDDPKEQEIWDRVVDNANCYAYAFGVDDDKTYFPQPGHFGVPEMREYRNLDREFTCSNYHSRLLLDNPVIYPVGHKKKCKDGYYKVYFTVAPNRDYHLYRQGTDGWYSHKPGSTPATLLDTSRKRISNPQKADRFNPPDNIDYHEPSALYYNTVCHSFCVPNKNVEHTFVE